MGGNAGAIGRGVREPGLLGWRGDCLAGRIFSEEISTENLGDVLLFGLYGLMLIQIVLRR